jgi:glycosyltransferase involved in cell wall biosynthesis
MGAPRVSIGVPVYNGEKYLRAALDSLTAQTFADIEIVVADNCSSDATASVAQECAARDPRVKYWRNATNLGPARNYNRTLELARGEYFRWHCADDSCTPDQVAKCVQLLDADPSVVLAYSRTGVIDPDGREIWRSPYELELDDARPSVRFARLVNADHRRHGAHELYGVVRTAALRAAGGMPSHVRGDSVLLVRLALLGRFRRVEEHLFMKREHPGRSTRYLDPGKVRPGSRLARLIGCGPLPGAEWWDPAMRGRIVFPEWRVLREYVRALCEAEHLGGARSLACTAVLAGFALRHVPKLGRDVAIAAEQFVNLRLRHHRRVAT